MPLIRPCTETDFGEMVDMINGAARAYATSIPADCYHVPYMPPQDLQREIEAGVRFWGSCEPPKGCRGSRLVGVMGIQDVDDVTLIRHAYVMPSEQRRGIGSGLLTHLEALATKPLLVGTWADATWAIRFYERHGFRLVTPAEKDRLLRRYWRIPDRQIETSVVLRIPR
jgi:GNAT superfamily N-acetyltransferase